MNPLLKCLKRTANFSLAETDLLVSLVNKYKGIIECLKTDTVNSKMKKDAWIKIQDEFNSQLMENHRTATVLKNKYDNIKRNVKKQYADEKSFSRGTGGGPTKSFQGSIPSTISSTIGDILQTRMTGEKPDYDSDNVNQSYAHLETDTMEHEDNGFSKNDIDHDIITITEMYIDEPTTNVQVEDSGPSAVTNNDSLWTSYSPADLKRRSNLTNSNIADSDGRVTKKKKTYQDKITKWASTRASLSEQQQSAFIEQHELKMQLMKQKHDIELKMMAEQHKIEIENLLLKNDILKIQKEKLTTP